MNQNKSHMKIIIKVICFGLIFCFLLQSITFVLRDKICSELILGFEDEQEQSLDVLFMGSSMSYQHVYPYELWNEYGIASYNLGTAAQILPITYYLLDYALEKQSPNVVVLDVGMCYEGNKQYSDERLHQVWDNVDWSVPKIKAIEDLAIHPAAFYIELIQYHSRWKDITEADFHENVDYAKGASACMARKAFEPVTILDPSEQEAPPQVSIEYLNKIIALCHEREIELVLTAMPTYRDAQERQKMFNYIGAMAQEQGIEFINFHFLMDELDIRWERDFFDETHLNYYAGQKVTNYLGSHLQQQYGISDHRGESAYMAWDAGYENYRKITDENLQQSGLVKLD